MRTRVVAPAAAAAALVVAAAVTASLSQFSLGARDVPTGEVDEEVGDARTPGPAPERSTEFLPEAYDWGLVVAVFFFLLLLVPVVLVAVAVWRQRRRRPTIRLRRRRLPAEPRSITVRDPAQDGDDLMAAVDESLATLAGGDDPRAAVIACWVRLQDVAGAAGVAARDADTANDLVLRLLRSHRISEPALAEFAEVYRLARYSPRSVDDQMSDQASRALEQVRQELGRSPVGGGS